MTRRFLTALTFAATTLAVGCYSPSPNLFQSSMSTFTYESTAMRPVTITVMDVRSEEPVFRMEVPVGKQISLHFDETGGDDPVLRPSKMSWAMWTAGTKFGSLSNTISVPAHDARRIEYSLRTGPEYAPPPVHASMRAGEAASKPEWETPAGGSTAPGNSERLYK